MKHYTILISTLLLLTTGCQKEEIHILNSQNTPDLSNPIIQKMTNIIWFKDGQTQTEHWASQNNIYKPSDYASTMLYQMAWVTMTLYRDGTSNMVFVPPFVKNTVIHCKGNWQVSTEEENTIIINTKTPVTTVNGKIKVLEMESRENIATVQLSVDFGDRIMTVGMINGTALEQTAALGQALDYDWFAQQDIVQQPLQSRDFIGAWAAPSTYNNDTDSEITAERITRIAYIEDLLSNTPAFIRGLAFNLRENGEAQIVYNGESGSLFSYEMGIPQQVYSDAKWSIKGNKILIETNEELFYSVGESMFNFVPHSVNLTLLGNTGSRTYASPIRIQSDRFYSIEIIEKNDKGFWARITTNTEVFYSFLYKTDINETNLFNIIDVFED